MLNQIYKTAYKNILNIPGWRTDRKLVVWESDDWGSIRMPSKQHYEKLLAKGLRVDRSLYDQYDALEQREDLELLLDILSSLEDGQGRSPIFTLNTVMGNPDFIRIEEDHFEKYHHEDFFKSYEVYNGESCEDLWTSGMQERLVRPQFHAREHLNVGLWMEALLKNFHETRFAFRHRFYGLKTKTPSPKQRHYLAAYWAENEHDLKDKARILDKGLEMFIQKFGYQSESFVACNFIYPMQMERTLARKGIRFIQTQPAHIAPDVKRGKLKKIRHFTGTTNSYHQSYLVRNCSFEPTLTPGTDAVDSCLKEMETAFKWRKPAIISTHRINYASRMSTVNRDENLKSLGRLLEKMLKRWPDIEFLSSDQLGRIMEES